MDNILKARIRRFLEMTKINKTVFCRGAGISSASLYRFINEDDDFCLSDEYQQRIIDFMDRYVMRLNDFQSKTI